jgi:hypothetical protein
MVEPQPLYTCKHDNGVSLDLVRLEEPFGRRITFNTTIPLRRAPTLYLEPKRSRQNAMISHL